MGKKIRKQVGHADPSRVLKRVYQLAQFLNPFKTRQTSEPNIKPIRKTVGRSRSFGH